MSQTIGTHNTLDEIVSSIGELPAAPAVVNAAVGMTSNLQANISEVSRVLASDQSITAKVLRLSNSPYYGRAQEVSTLQEAILVLGFMAVRSIVIAASTHDMYSSNEKDGPESKLWRHSLSTALAARQIAIHLKHPGKEEIFVAGLLHDIGKLVLIKQAPDSYFKIVKDVESDNGSFLNMEKHVFHFNHCDVASLLLKKWSFPSSLVSAVLKHHSPPSFRRGSTIPIAQVINLANQMAKKLGVGFADECIDNLTHLESTRLMSLDNKDLDAIFEEFCQHYQTEMQIFEPN